MDWPKLHHHFQVADMAFHYRSVKTPLIKLITKNHTFTMLRMTNNVIKKDRNWFEMNEFKTIVTINNWSYFYFFVRSIFFHLGLKFKKTYKAVLDASETGGVDVRIIVPKQIADDTAFLYQLRFADKPHELEYNGAKLDRFVYQSADDNEVRFYHHNWKSLRWFVLSYS